MIKHCTQTVRATEPRLVLNCRFFQVVFRPLIVFCFEQKKNIKIRQEKKCVFFFDLSSTTPSGLPKRRPSKNAGNLSNVHVVQNIALGASARMQC